MAVERCRAWADRRVGPLPVFPLLAAILFAVALGLPALEVAGGRVYSGLEVLLEGWRGARAGVFAWFANPLFGAAFALALGGYRRAAGVASGAGCLLALTSFAAASIARQQGMALPELDYLAGFHVWLAAQFGLLAWCWAGVRAAPSS